MARVMDSDRVSRVHATEHTMAKFGRRIKMLNRYFTVNCVDAS